jgi:peptidoglycan hydrolase-like protein with peptidoglycan-binding domain
MPVSEATGFAQMVLRVCGQDDTQSVELAALKTLNVFAPLRVQVESPLVQISWNGKQLSVRQETIRTVQAELQKRGVYDSAVDGTFGPKTAEAIVAFQKSKSIPETGLPDALTLANLLIAE